jgi:hypothetical protein
MALVSGTKIRHDGRNPNDKLLGLLYTVALNRYLSVASARDNFSRQDSKKIVPLFVNRLSI